MEELNNFGLRELLDMILKENSAAQKANGKERTEAHLRCKSAVEELINRDYGVVSKTIGVLHKSGTGFGCPGCLDIRSYAHALINRDIGEQKRIESTHGVFRSGSYMVEQGIEYYTH